MASWDTAVTPAPRLRLKARVLVAKSLGEGADVSEAPFQASPESEPWGFRLRLL